MFPAGVGMNRIIQHIGILEKMFPAGVGMNRKLEMVRYHCYVPRRRGDEPESLQPIMSMRLCSPQAWG